MVWNDVKWFAMNEPINSWSKARSSNPSKTNVFVNSYDEIRQIIGVTNELQNILIKLENN